MNKNFFKSILMSLGLLVGCNNQPETQNKTSDKHTARSIPVVTLQARDTTVYKEYIAEIQASRNVEMRSRLAGFLEQIYVDEGSVVKKGQIVFKVSDEEYRSELARATASKSNARAEAKKIELEIEKTTRLVNKNIVSETELELLNVQLNAADSYISEMEAMVQKAQNRLSFTNIRAPFDGVINRIFLKEGSLLNEGSLLTSISDVDSVNVYFDISESEYLTLALDPNFLASNFRTKVVLKLANGLKYPYSGTAEIVESEFESQTGSISLRAKFPNPQGILTHGASGRIGVPVATGHVLFVPQKAVLEIQDRTYVYILNNDSTVTMTPFKSGQRVGHYYLVKEGLTAGDKVVYEGVKSLKDGAKIKPKQAKITEK